MMDCLLSKYSGILFCLRVIDSFSKFIKVIVNEVVILMVVFFFLICCEYSNIVVFVDSYLLIVKMIFVYK